MSTPSPPVDELVGAAAGARRADGGDRARPRHDGILVLLAIDRLALGQELRYDVAAACDGTGLPEEELRHIWRSLGFPDPTPGEPVFSDVDLGNLAAVADLMHSGVVSPEVTYGMTRVIGSSMARIASALDRRGQRPGRADRPATTSTDAERSEVLEPIASQADGFLPMFPEVLEQVWRRHLQVGRPAPAAARRRGRRARAWSSGSPTWSGSRRWRSR